MLVEFAFIWLFTALGLWLVTLIVPGVNARSTGGLWLAALVLGLANSFVRPVLWVLTLPITVATFGLFALVMVLFGVAAFMLLEWWMFDSVHWIYMDHRDGNYI